MAVIHFRNGTHHAVRLVADAAELVIEEPFDNVRRNTKLVIFGTFLGLIAMVLILERIGVI